MPKDALIHEAQVLASSLSKEVLQKRLFKDELKDPEWLVVFGQVLFALFVMREIKSGKSRYKPYLDILPMEGS